MNNQVKLIEGIRAKLEDQNEPVEVVQIDFINKTFTWLFRGHLENTESFDDVEYWVLPDTPPVPTIKPGDTISDLMFAYINKDADCPHDFEIKVFEDAIGYLRNEQYQSNKYSPDLFESHLKQMREVVE